MKKLSRFLLLGIFTLLPALSFGADLGGLVGALTSQLGVSQEQASGGIGALLGSAKGQMGDSKYGDLLSKAPSLNGLATDTASSSDSGGSSWGGYMNQASSLLGGGETMSQMTKLAETFDGLGLGPDMVGKYSKVALDYVQGEGGTGAMDLLKSGLSF